MSNGSRMTPARREMIAIQSKLEQQDKIMAVLVKDSGENKTMLHEIKTVLSGSDALKSEGVLQDIGKLKRIVTELVALVEELKNKVLHIFKWRDGYIIEQTERIKLKREIQAKTEEKKERWFDKKVAMWGIIFAALSMLYTIIDGLIKIIRWLE